MTRTKARAAARECRGGEITDRDGRVGCTPSVRAMLCRVESVWSAIGLSLEGQATDGVVFVDANFWLSQNSLSTAFVLEGRLDHGWLFVYQLFTVRQSPGIFRLMIKRS